MAQSLNSHASLRRRSREGITADTALPRNFRVTSERVMQLLKDYYEFMNIKGSPTHEISSIMASRDLDQADDVYLDQIRKEIAVAVPSIASTNKQFLYKGITNYYKLRGSIDSIEIFFKVLLLDDVEIVYPFEKVLIPSDGRWDADAQIPTFDEFGNQTGFKSGTFLSNKGFLSDDIYIQDSYFYQKFSYVIRTGQNQERWGLTYAKLVHPAGFIFFSEILMILVGLNGGSVMPHFQPGFIGVEDIPFIIELFASVSNVNPTLLVEITKLLEIYGNEDNNQFNERRWVDMLKAYDTTPMSAYEQYSVEDMESYNINRRYNVGTIITQSPN